MRNHGRGSQDAEEQARGRSRSPRAKTGDNEAQDKEKEETVIIDDDAMGQSDIPDFQDVVGTAVQQGWELCDEGGTGDCGYRSLCTAMAYNADHTRVDNDTAIG